MLRSSLSLGRWLGVELRLHLSFPLLFLACVAYGAFAANNPLRGLGLFAAILLAVIVREGTRLLAAAYEGLSVRAHVLLPIGGVLALAPQPGAQPSLRAITFAAPIANLAAGLLLLGAGYALDPNVHLLQSPWVGAGNILRSVVWTQFLMAAVNLIPATMIPAQKFLGRDAGHNAADPNAAASIPAAARAFPPGSGIALAVMVVGIITMNLWMVMAGLLFVVFLQLQSQAGNVAAGKDGAPGAPDVTVADVMLTDFAVLSSSDTLLGAMERSRRSFQEVFPVVRGDRLVGSVLRQTVGERLQAEGDSYLQGVMTRKLEVANPTEPLIVALRRASHHQGSEFIPVSEDGRLVGILTPQSLNGAVEHLRRARAPSSGNE